MWNEPLDRNSFLYHKLRKLMDKIYWTRFEYDGRHYMMSFEYNIFEVPPSDVAKLTTIHSVQNKW